MTDEAPGTRFVTLGQLVLWAGLVPLFGVAGGLIVALVTLLTGGL